MSCCEQMTYGRRIFEKCKEGLLHLHFGMSSYSPHDSQVCSRIATCKSHRKFDAIAIVCFTVEKEAIALYAECQTYKGENLIC